MKKTTAENFLKWLQWRNEQQEQQEREQERERLRQMLRDFERSTVTPQTFH